MLASLAVLSLVVHAATPIQTDLSVETVATDDVYRPELVSLSAGAPTGPQLQLSLPWLLGTAPTGSEGAWLRIPAVGFGLSWSPARARGLTFAVSPQMEFGDARYVSSDVEATIPLSLTQSLGVFVFGLESGRTFAPGGGQWGTAGSITALLTPTILVRGGVTVQSTTDVFGNVVANWTPPGGCSLSLIAGIGPSGRNGAAQALGLLALQIAV